MTSRAAVARVGVIVVVALLLMLAVGFKEGVESASVNAAAAVDSVAAGTRGSPPLPTERATRPSTLPPSFAYACLPNDIAISHRDPPDGATDVTAVVVSIPFVDVVADRAAWFDPAKLVKRASVPFSSALPVAALERLVAAGRTTEGLCTVIVVYHDPALDVPFTRDSDVERKIGAMWSTVASPAASADECRVCRSTVRRVVALRVRAAGSGIAEEHHGIFRVVSALFAGTIDASLPRPAAVAVVSGDTFPDQHAPGDWVRAMSAELQESGGGAIVGSVLALGNGHTRCTGLATTTRQAAGGAGLTDPMPGWASNDPRVTPTREVFYLPHGAFAVTRPTWRKLKAATASPGDGHGASGRPIMDGDDITAPPDPLVLARKSVTAVAAIRGAIAVAKPAADALRHYGAVVSDSPAKTAVGRLSGRLRRAELASDAAEAFLRLAHEGARWRHKMEPHTAPRKETLMSMQCPGWVTDRVGGHYDLRSIPGLLARGTGDRGEGVPLVAIVVGNSSTDEMAAVLRFVDGDATDETGRLNETLLLSSKSASLAAAAAALRDLGRVLNHSNHNGVARRAAVKAADDALGAAYSDTVTISSFVDTQTDALLGLYQTLERLCTSAWPMSQWAQLHTAAIKAGVRRLVSSNATVVYMENPPDHHGVPLDDGERLRFVNMLQFADMNWFPLTVGVSADDPAFVELERRAAQTFLTTTAKVQWGLPCDCAGFTVEAGWIISGLRSFVEVAHGNSPVCYCPGLHGETNEAVWNAFNDASSPMFRWRTFPALRGSGVEDVVDVRVHHWDPIAADNIRWGATPRGGDYHVMRAMYEFSRIPSAWVSPLNSGKFDEIWVPCAFVERAFIDSGVNASKIRIVPEPVDVETFSPERVDKLPIPVQGYLRAIIDKRPDDEVRESFKFCSLFKFEPRKGWRALMEAFFTSFTRSDKVSLFVVGFLWGPDLPKGARGSDDPDALRVLVEAEAVRHGVIHRDEMPYFEAITNRMSDHDVARFYKMCDAFVLPSHGEGWGLPVIQAMAMGLPTITINGTGISAFTTNDTVLYVNASEQPAPAEARRLYGVPDGASWLEPDVADLSRVLKHVRHMPYGERETLGRRAMQHVRDGFNPRRVGRQIAERVVEIEALVRQRRATSMQPMGADAERSGTR